MLQSYAFMMAKGDDHRMFTATGNTVMAAMMAARLFAREYHDFGDARIVAAMFDLPSDGPAPE